MQQSQGKLLNLTMLPLRAMVVLTGIAPAFADYQKKPKKRRIHPNPLLRCRRETLPPQLPGRPESHPYNFMWASGVAVLGSRRCGPVEPGQVPQAPVQGFNAYCSGPGGTLLLAAASPIPTPTPEPS